MLSGSQTRTCEADEMWSLPEPMCGGKFLVLFKFCSLAVMTITYLFSTVVG